MTPRHVTVAVTGASGTCYAQRALEVLVDAGLEVTLVVSAGGARVAQIEAGLRIDPEAPDPRVLLRREAVPGNVHGVAVSDIAAGVCSGTHPIDAMIVVPCSMGTLGRIVAGTAANVVERGADVMLKEGRPLVLVVRETPLSRIHLENMLRAHDAGAAIVPASPGFYHQPESIADLVDHVLQKAFDRMRVPAELIRRWKVPRET